jgi:branched-chain amino acid transport system substrate-binding protein
MKLRHGLLFTIALGTVLLAAGCGGSGKGGDDLVVGVYGSLTGNDATFGESTKLGVELALSELQASKQGKIGGLTLRSVVEDDQGRAEEAATVVQKLINQDQVAAVIGEVASSRSLAAAPICQAAGVPMITPSSTNPKVTEVGEFISRMCFIDPFRTVMAKFAAQNLGVKKVAILKDVKSDYSVGLSQYFTQAFTAAGGSIVAEQAYSAGDQDFSAQLTAIKGKGPEAIFIPGYYTEVGLIARKARELGLTCPLLGGDGWESEQLIEIGGDALNGAYYSNHFAVDNPDPKLQDFLKHYREKFGKDPDAIGGLATTRPTFVRPPRSSPPTTNGFKALAASRRARRAGGAQKVAAMIAATSGYAGVTGVITLDANRNASKPAVVLEIKGGKKVFNTSINP